MKFPSPGKFYKKGSQEKTHLQRLDVFLLRSPFEGAGGVLSCRARCSVAGHGGPAVRFSLPAVFITCSQRSLSVPKPAKQNGGQLATIVLSGTRGPWLFLVIREGLGSAVRLRARGTQRLSSQLRLALEPECLENSTATAREIPRDGAGSIR